MSDILDGGPSPFPCAVCEQQEAPVITSTGGPLARILRGHTPIHTFKESQCDAHAHSSTRASAMRARETIVNTCRARRVVPRLCCVRFDVYSILDDNGEISFRLHVTRRWNDDEFQRVVEFRLSLEERSVLG